jgi:hypothetical protein
MGKSLKDIYQKESASERLERKRREKREAKKAEERKRGNMKGVKLDRERKNGSKKIKAKTMTAEERKAAGRTKQSRRDLRDPTLMGRRQAGRSFPTFEEGQKQSAYSRKFGGSNKLLGGISIPAIAKAKPAFTEVEKPPKTTIDGKRLMKAGGRIRMDGTAKPR